MSKDYLCFSVECVDSCFWISTVIVPLLTYLVIQGLRPRLSISSLEKGEDCIKVEVVNRSWFFDANNLRIEICAFNIKSGYTYHFEPDHPEFLILPNRSLFFKKDNSKNFVCRKAADSAKIHLKKEAGIENLTEKQGFDMLMIKLNQGYKLRARCHAYHSFSGLGKSFEKVF